MELALFAAACLCFAISPSLAGLALRCGLAACLRFSPRAALALAGVADFSANAAMLLRRGGLRAVPIAQRSPVVLAGVFGSVIGRMLMLLFVARFSGSLALLRAQAAPLLLLALLALPQGGLRRFSFPQGKLRLFALALFCAMIDGLCGAGGAVLFSLAARGGSRRNRPPSAAALLSVCAQASAILLTLLSGAAQVFPMRLLLFLSLGAAGGALIFEQRKKRGAILSGLRIALNVYLLCAALAGAEQAYFH